MLNFISLSLTGSYDSLFWRQGRFAQFNDPKLNLIYSVS